MSQENVEIIRGFEHAVATGEPPWCIIDPNVEVHDHDSPDQTEYRGHAGYARHPNIELIVADGPSPGRSEGLPAMAASARDLFSVWEDLRAVAEEYRALDGERVLVLDHRTGHGKTSGLELAEMPTQGGTVWHMRDGKVTRLVVYFDRDRALADLGLGPEGG